MFYNIIIFQLFILSKVSLGIQYCETGLDKCHDGGCSYMKPGETVEKCVCTFSMGVMNGKSCGNYEDKCLNNPCKNNGKCVSGIGHHICECEDKFHGVNCEIPIGKLNILQV